ncbi:TPA: conjugal transfer protein TraP [Escherichia coli]|nr:conjugal transfer protein TraP [Escherichia coli]HAV8264485.1 conjugal transfer protein TraP [Escherichia coli]HBC2920752.1 conjugal transfer protein TraP [Escherichia coli]
MENIPFFRRTCSAARYVVACVLRGLSWCLMYTIILPLGTMALMALLVLWKDNTTPGKLLAQEIEYVRDRTPAGLYPVRYCTDNLGSDLAMPPSVTCGFRRGDAAEYARETDRSLMQRGSALWAVLALVYVSLALFTRKDSENSEKKYIRVATADERLKDIFAEDASCISGKITKHHVYFPDHRINKHDEDKR